MFLPTAAVSAQHSANRTTQQVSTSPVQPVGAIEAFPIALKNNNGIPARGTTVLPNAVTTASNYAFTTATNAALADMSSGTAQLLARDLNDVASALTNIGFDFFFQGVRFDQFSVNENGVLRLGGVAQTGSPYQPLDQNNLSIITAFGADQRTHAYDGKVHFKVTRSAPDRVLIVEWLNKRPPLIFH